MYQQYSGVILGPCGSKIQYGNILMEDLRINMESLKSGWLPLIFVLHLLANPKPYLHEIYAY